MARLTAEQIATRNEKIVVCRLQHPTMTWPDIAAMHSVSEKTARRAWDNFTAERRHQLVESTENYMDIVTEKLAAFAQLRSEAATTYAHADNPSAKVGALKLILELHEEEISLMQKTKLLPQDLGAVRIQLDIDHLADSMLDLIQKFVPKAKRDQAELFLIDRMKPKPELPAAVA